MRKGKGIRYALELKDGEQVRDLESLQEHFDLEKVIGYFQDGRLLAWLKDRFYADEADAIEKLSGDESDLGEQLCRIFHIEHSEMQDTDDPETIAWRKERLERLKQYTADSSVMQHVDLVAFDQDDLAEILHEEDTHTVYLCQNTFIFPSGILRKKDMTYIGVGKNVEVVIKSREVVDFDSLGITFENVQFDEAYSLLQKDTPDKFFELGENAEEQENFDEAIKWYTKAADMGHAYAMNNLGDIYYSGKSGEKDVTKAFALFQKAADSGNAKSMAWLGVGYQYGNECLERNIEKALEWYQKSAQKKFPASMVGLGDLYQDGIGIPQNYEKAVSWYEQAIECGSSTDGWTIAAIDRLATMYRMGKGVSQDYKKAFELYKQAAEEEDSDAMCWVGIFYNCGYGVEENPKLAAEWFEKAANAGDAYAMSCIGNKYRLGEGVPQNLDKALQWFQKGVEAKDSDAMIGLADMYREGEGVAQDYSKAFELYKQAAEQEDSEAMLVVGVFYDRGWGVKENKKLALEWYQKAADEGNVTAMINLAYMYREGEGVAQDFDKSIEWCQKAADAGDEDAIKYLEELDAGSGGTTSSAVNSDLHMDTDFLAEFIYRIQKSSIPFYVSDGSGFFSVPSCDFIYDKSLRSSDPKRHDILEDSKLLGQSEVLICALEIRHPLSCDGFAFTDQVMYAKGKVYMPYAAIQDIQISRRYLKIFAKDGSSWDVNCEMFNPEAIKLFLKVAAGMQSFTTSEKGLLYDMHMEIFNGHSVGELLGI